MSSRKQQHRRPGQSLGARLARLSLVAALSASIGLHWAILQSIAWTGMVVRFAREGALSQALAKTFDGAHPCCLCKAVQQGRDAEKKQDDYPGKPASKLDFLLISSQLRIFSPRLVMLRSTSPPRVSGRRDPPPRPVPRPLHSHVFV